MIVSSASQRHTVHGDITRLSATLTPAPGLRVWPRDGTPLIAVSAAHVALSAPWAARSPIKLKDASATTTRMNSW